MKNWILDSLSFLLWLRGEVHLTPQNQSCFKNVFEGDKIILLFAVCELYDFLKFLHRFPPLIIKKISCLHIILLLNLLLQVRFGI